MNAPDLASTEEALEPLQDLWIQDIIRLPALLTPKRLRGNAERPQLVEGVRGVLKDAEKGTRRRRNGRELFPEGGMRHGSLEGAQRPRRPRIRRPQRRRHRRPSVPIIIGLTGRCGRHWR